MPKWHEIAGAVVFMAAVYLLIQWIVISFAITGNGVIKWKEGWHEMVCHYTECEE